MLYSFLYGVCLLGIAAANPLQKRYAVKETHNVPLEFAKIGDAPSGHRIRLNVALKQSRFDELESHLSEISDPDHSRYGQYLSLDEVNDFVKPSDKSLKLVREWLHEFVDADRIEYSPANDFLSFTLPVEKVETLLDTKYFVYRHNDGFEIVRTPEWKLPMHLHDHVVAVQPTTSFLRTTPQLRHSPNKGSLSVPRAIEDPLQYRPVNNPTVDQVCTTAGVTPLCLRTLYETINYVPKVPNINQIGVTNYLHESPNRSDIRIFLQKYRPEAIAAADQFKLISIANGSVTQDPEAPYGAEASLDSTTVLGIAWPTRLTAWTTGGTPPNTPDADGYNDSNEPYLTWVNYVLQQDSIPQVITNSYIDNEQTVPYSYAKVVCSQFAQLGARGVSVIFASGDGGVSGTKPGGACISNTNNRTAFIPHFPASCPYVTTVGGTMNFAPEIVAYEPSWNFSPGGGFSNYFPQPDYQSPFVSKYLSIIGDENSNLYNRFGRAYPDISASSIHFDVIWNGTQLLPIEDCDGTSASTPTVAAIFSLLNDALISHGRPPMGFLNPWLYKRGWKAFVDVKEGAILGCNTTGFPATEGWDVASGFGAPRFRELLKAVGL